MYIVCVFNNCCLLYCKNIHVTDIHVCIRNNKVILNLNLNLWQHNTVFMVPRSVGRQLTFYNLYILVLIKSFICNLKHLINTIIWVLIKCCILYYMYIIYIENKIHCHLSMFTYVEFFYVD